MPPYDCGLDLAPRLDEDLQIQLEGGEPDMVPVGSTAVADVDREFQPLASLHGHIHEGRGITKSDAQPSSTPAASTTRPPCSGAILDVKPGKKPCQLVAG